jgi:hypothetical protein
MITHFIRVIAWVGAVAALPAFAGTAAASCLPGATPSYDDIRYVAVQQYSLTAQRPRYAYEARYTPSGSGTPPYAFATLKATRNVPITGDFVAAKPAAVYASSIAILRSAQFFDIRLSTPAAGQSRYIDGPEDTVTVVACGIRWALGTANTGDSIDIGNAQARQFFKLENDLRAAIFSSQWVRQTRTP